MKKNHDLVVINLPRNDNQSITFTVKLTSISTAKPLLNSTLETVVEKVRRFLQFPHHRYRQ